MKTLVLGLGNTLICDDGVGVYTARACTGRFDGLADVREAELGGVDLIEMLQGYERAIIVDAIQLEGEIPGTVFRIRPDDMQITPRLASVHDIDLVTALELGRRLGFSMPGDVVVYAVQGEDMVTIHEGCRAAVEAVIEPLAREIEGLVKGETKERISIPLAGRKRNA